MLVPNAIYWDDWTLYQVSSEVIYDTFNQAGSMFNIGGHMHVAFLSIGPWFYKILTFVLMFGAGIALDNILRKYNSVSTEARFLIVLFFLVLPFYWARVALIDIGYTISYFLFFLAWACIDRHRLIPLVLFFLSFNTNSLLVFYALPFLDVYYRSVNGPISLRSFVEYSLRKIDFVALPFAYFALKLWLYSPWGEYAGYNESYRLVNLVAAPLLMAFDFFTVGFPVLLAISLFIALSTLLRSRFSLRQCYFEGVQSAWYAVGCVAFFLGGFAYWVLGLVPTFYEWNSRHQLLLPFGTALVIAIYISGTRREARVSTFVFFVSIFLAMDLTSYKSLYTDGKKQERLIQLFSTNQIMRESQLIVFDDQMRDVNYTGRTYRSYEWDGIMKAAFGDATRRGVNFVQFEEMANKGGNVDDIIYNKAGFSHRAPLKVAKVVISHKDIRFREKMLSLGELQVQIDVTPIQFQVQ